ncbi:MAG: hypothetical protein E7386_01140 [Ruminococcaceae bacterium]|nr:hypothetical protein [Oscillospiraceae bacterium]
MNTADMPVVNQMPQYVKMVLNNIPPTQSADYSNVGSTVKAGVENAIGGVAKAAGNLAKSAVNAIDKTTDEILDSGANKSSGMGM